MFRAGKWNTSKTKFSIFMGLKKDFLKFLPSAKYMMKNTFDCDVFRTFCTLTKVC